MNKSFLLIAAVFIIAGGLYVFGQNNTTSSDELVVYSGRKEQLILPIIQSFEEETGIEVTLKHGKSAELANILLEEGDQTSADIYIGTDASLLEKLSANDVFTPIESERLKDIPQEYRSEDGLWTGVSGRTRVLIVNTDKVAEEDYPTSVYDIFEPTWNGKAAMAKLTNESVVTHLSAISLVRSAEFTEGLLEKIELHDIALLGGHTDVRKAVASGEFSVGLVNHYYGHLQQQESDNVEILYVDQGEDQDGSFVNVAGAGIVQYGNNTEAAQAFIEFLLQPETQKQFAELNFEFPLVAEVVSENTKNLDEFVHMDLSLHAVTIELENTLEMIKRAGY